jgi:ribosomal protein L5
MIGASVRSTASSAAHFEHLTEDQPTILQSRSAAMPYQLREARNEASALVWPTLNSE